MIAVAKVVNDWSDPDGVEAKALNVVKVVLNSFPGSTAVVAEIGAGSIVVAAGLSESVRKDLIDGLTFPVVGVSSLNCSEGSKSDNF